MHEEKDNRFLPPRMRVHRSEKGRWTMLFYRLCLVLLICLVIGSAAWGIFYTK